MKKLLLFTILTSFAFSTYAQRNANAEYWNSFHYKAKEGKEQKFLDAAAKKTKMFNSEADNIIVTYRITTGDNSGVYERLMPYQTSKNYDLDKSKELKYWSENVAPFATPVGGQQIWRRMQWGDANIKPDGAPFKYLSKTTYLIKPSHRDVFQVWVERIGKVFAKRRPDSARVVFRLESGGQGNTYVSYFGYNKFEHNNPKQDLTWEQEYNEMFGAGSWDVDLKSFNDSKEMIVGEIRENLELVPELLPNN
tara:strand:- start:102 stop:854 length:753 start_codon:yes stop_codon:yes gene_type:complete